MIQDARDDNEHAAPDGWEAAASLVLLKTAPLDSMGTRQHLARVSFILLGWRGERGAHACLKRGLQTIHAAELG